MASKPPSPGRLKPFWRAVIEIGFIVFLFYSNLLMGEFTRANGRGKPRSSLWRMSSRKPILRSPWLPASWVTWSWSIFGRKSRFPNPQIRRKPGRGSRGAPGCASMAAFLRQVRSEGADMKIALELALLALVAGAGMPALAEGGREAQTFKTSKGDVKITPIYHASLLIQAGGKNIYIDPAKPADVSGMPQADLILITDIHGDHMDTNLIAKISKPGTQVIAPLAVAKTVTAAAPLSNGE